MFGVGGGRRLFKRPAEDEVIGKVVKAKPIAAHIAKRLDSYSSKDFVTATNTQSDFYGDNKILGMWYKYFRNY